MLLRNISIKYSHNLDKFIHADLGDLKIMLLSTIIPKKKLILLSLACIKDKLMDCISLLGSNSLEKKKTRKRVKGIRGKRK